MATWNKIIVSGSQAELAGITGSLLTDDKLLFAKNGGAITSTEITVNEAGHLDGIFSGSFSGSFTGDLVGNATTATTADKVKSSLTDGDGIADFTFDGSTATSVSVQLDGATLKVGASGLAVNELGVDTAQLAEGAVTFTKLDADSVVDSAEGISLATTGSDDSVATTKAIYDFVTNQVGGATLAISSSDGAGSNIAIDLNDEALTLTGNDGLEFNLSVNDAGIGITNGGILPVKLDSTLAGDGLTSTDGVLSLTNDTISGIALGSDLADLTVDDSSLELSTGTTYNGGTAQTISVKDLGITNDMLAGSIANDKLVHDGITFGTNDVSLGDTVTQMSLTGFTGSLSSTSVLADGVAATTQPSGDDSTKVATTAFVTDAVDSLSSTLTVDADSGTQNVDLKNDDLQILGTTDEINTEVTKVGTDVTVKVGLPDNVKITQDLTVGGDLVVTGTASFRHEEILEIADQFILMGSGSTTAQPGGIVVQQATQNVGELFGFDNATQRWGVTGSFDSTSDTFSTNAFMATVVVGGVGENDPSAMPAKYLKTGNMFIGADGTPFIITSEA